jgi:formamidopyrimidine-DNA glycosylase
MNHASHGESLKGIQGCNKLFTPGGRPFYNIHGSTDRESMFELPEILTLAQQLNDSLTGKVIQRGELGNSPHKFVWYNRSHEEFKTLTQGKSIGRASVKGRWLFLPVDPGYVLLIGECGGKILLHNAGAAMPKKYHLRLIFDDASYLTITTQMWGAMELFERGQEMEREYVKGMRITPVDPEFTLHYFNELIDAMLEGKQRSVKSLLTQDQLIPGLGNAIAQDILFKARLHPKFPIDELKRAQRQALFQATVETVLEITERGGRYDEYDLYGNRGGYVRLMDKNALQRPCPSCGGVITKIQYLGGSCYLCAECQILPPN